MTGHILRKSYIPPPTGMAGLRVALLDLIAAVHDQEADRGAQPAKTASDHAVLAALFAARIGLQDQIVTLHKAEMLGKARPELWEPALARACQRMNAALSRSAQCDQLIPSATDGIAAAGGLLADLRDDEGKT
jgi:hypothetical protein